MRILSLILNQISFCFRPSCSARDEEAGEIPVAFVVRKDGSALSEAAVIDFVSKQVKKLGTRDTFGSSCFLKKS